MHEKICISETSQTKSACASLQSDQSLLIPLTEFKKYFRKYRRTMEQMIRVRECAGWPWHALLISVYAHVAYETNFAA